MLLMFSGRSVACCCSKAGAGVASLLCDFQHLDDGVDSDRSDFLIFFVG